jgi:L-aminopeptidase/D-esterase-like protein
MRALDSAASGRIAEGNVGGGTGMLCNGFKGGTGSASRVLASEAGGFTLGVLVQCNYGSRSQLRVAGIPVGREIMGFEPCVAQKLEPPVLTFDGKPAPTCTDNPGSSAPRSDSMEEAEQGSIIVVVGTDAPLTPDQLKRIARRVSLGMGRMGSIHGNGSGDIFIAFSTANRGADAGNSDTDGSALPPAKIQRLASDAMDPLFTATAEAVEEAILNAMLAADTMTGADYWRYYGLPHTELQEVLRKHGRLVEKKTSQ